MKIKYVILMLALASLYTCAIGKPKKPQLPLQGVVVIIDPGHGDRGNDYIPADPGSHATCPNGEDAWEAIFTWDVAMRLRSHIVNKGGKVFLTLRDPSGDYTPKNWGPQKFPLLGKKGTELFLYKTLVDIPDPKTITEALASRAATANRIYRKYKATSDVYFLSIHFDSTSPTVVGMSFYHATAGGTPFKHVLCEQIKREKREHKYIATGEPHKLCIPKNYAVLRNSINPDSYLIELGNIQSDNEGRNPDLWRMRNPKSREAYAKLLTRALVKRRLIPKIKGSLIEI